MSYSCWLMQPKIGLCHIQVGWCKGYLFYVIFMLVNAKVTCFMSYSCFYAKLAIFTCHIHVDCWKCDSFDVISMFSLQKWHFYVILKMVESTLPFFSYIFMFLDAMFTFLCHFHVGWQKVELFNVTFKLVDAKDTCFMSYSCWSMQWWHLLYHVHVFMQSWQFFHVLLMLVEGNVIRLMSFLWVFLQKWHFYVIFQMVDSKLALFCHIFMLLDTK